MLRRPDPRRTKLRARGGDAIRPGPWTPRRRRRGTAAPRGSGGRGTRSSRRRRPRPRSLVECGRLRSRRMASGKMVEQPFGLDDAGDPSPELSTARPSDLVLCAGRLRGRTPPRGRASRASGARRDPRPFARWPNPPRAAGIRDRGRREARGRATGRPLRRAPRSRGRAIFARGGRVRRGLRRPVGPRTGRSPDRGNGPADPIARRASSRASSRAEGSDRPRSACRPRSFFTETNVGGRCGRMSFSPSNAASAAPSSSRPRPAAAINMRPRRGARGRPSRSRPSAVIDPDASTAPTVAQGRREAAPEAIECFGRRHLEPAELRRVAPVPGFQGQDRGGEVDAANLGLVKGRSGPDPRGCGRLRRRQRPGEVRPARQHAESAAGAADSTEFEAIQAARGVVPRRSSRAPSRSRSSRQRL